MSSGLPTTIDNKFIKKHQSQYLNKIKILVNLLHKELKTKLDEPIFTIFFINCLTVNLDHVTLSRHCERRHHFWILMVLQSV